jgi:hypothetical protein
VSVVFVTQWIIQISHIFSRQECLDFRMFSKGRLTVCNFTICDNIPLYVNTGISKVKVLPITGHEDPEGE